MTPLDASKRDPDSHLYSAMLAGMHPIVPYRLWTEVSDWLPRKIVIYIAFRVVEDGEMHKFTFRTDKLDLDPATNEVWAFKLGRTILNEMAKQPKYAEVLKGN